ncbi:hypothetical protein BFU36_12070 [Sulfolobus sp. A20]|uniref:hypothetical protein n=1 Tax=Sulfolobaceae TaxID=118883 RepID=UPI0008461049|nr:MULTISPECIES: hypothetical protein [unclassified Sulfolobus]TRM74439.1 hypothetical protein DJ532_12825 [Sulfolobus sp. A20-N-F8]TRM75535.1 hypothetical protein DJ528_09255 [Sulfolobus sp. B5]TRM84418.1 hypothetical protein DJ522_04835 [Sulfolobus sp. F3]TRM85679.1 hypothetical protein DJ526_11015 [Sulfolobus sp. A20-N-G8]TRM86581.1 hypothetical protein DJ529_10930 [Sulfolobus sp. C3]TRM86693.1 hypothetical protein DJ521_05025 [Sulfolobus sp. E3]TRM97356.1 hypothetical protein DJ530_12170
MSQSLKPSYEVKVIKPLVAKIVINDEIVFIRVFPIPAHVKVQEDGFVVSVTATLTVESNKPKMGFPCNMIGSSTPVVPSNIEFIDEGVVIIQAGSKEITVKPKITSVFVYPGFRDDLGYPCVRVSWISLTNVK